jgi:hypothetical protein
MATRSPYRATALSFFKPSVGVASTQTARRGSLARTRLDRGLNMTPVSSGNKAMLNFTSTNFMS